jgi:hypothetical protein
MYIKIKFKRKKQFRGGHRLSLVRFIIGTSGLWFVGYTGVSMSLSSLMSKDNFILTIERCQWSLPSVHFLHGAQLIVRGGLFI